MKTLPVEYWEHDYIDLPTYYQRYWVQRCLELLDADTGHMSGLPLVNSASLIRELINTPPNRPNSNRFGSNSRTFHFLLNEFAAWFSRDDVLHRFLTDQGVSMPLSWNELKKVLNDGTDMSSKLFDASGIERGNSEGVTLKGFATWLQSEGMAEGSGTGIVKQVHNLLQDWQDEWIRAHEYTLWNLLRQLDTEACEPVEVALETATCSWLLEMVVQRNHSPTYLSEVLRSVFLEHSRQDFLTRLDSLFDLLRVNRREFTVFMRLQARRELGRIGQVGHVSFSTSCQEGNRVAVRLLSEGTLRPKEGKRAKDFFYRGETTPRFVFAVAQMEAENTGNAARLALEQLDIALKQARFEFERSTLSVDNVIYIYDSTNHCLERFTKRQAQADRYVSHGHPVRFERLVCRLNELQSVPKPWLKETIIDQVSDLALQWHRHAVESSAPEIRFMNHWIELEQLFKTARAENLTPLSPGDAVVQTLAGALAEEERIHTLEDLWGDLKRCNVLGPKPYLVRHTGRVRYTQAYLDRLYGSRSKTHTRSYRRWKKQPIDIEIRDLNRHKRLKGYRIPPGYRVFFNDNDKVSAGHWLAGPDLHEATKPEYFRPLFARSSPNLVSALYLVQCWPETIKSSLTAEQRTQLDDHRWRRLSQLALRDVQDFEQAGRLGHELSCPVTQLATDQERLDALLARQGWPIETGLRARLRHVSSRLQALEKQGHLATLHDLERIARALVSSEKTPVRVWLELFRDCPLDYRKLEQILRHHVDDLLEDLPDQPLLLSRVKQASRVIRTDDSESRITKYIWSLDRMRRTRNEIVHTGVVPRNMSLFARQLYHYSKIYIRLILYALTSPTCATDPLRKALYL
jgi:hypothetical protein